MPRSTAPPARKTMANLKVHRNASLPATTTLSVSQHQALASLLTGSTVTAAAEAAGVDRTTVNRWRTSDPAFVAMLNSLRVEMAESVRSGLRLLAGDALRAMREILTDPKTPACVRAKVAADVLRYTLDTPILGPTTEKDAQAKIDNPIIGPMLPSPKPLA